MIPVTRLCDQYAWLYTDLAVPSGTWDRLVLADGAPNGCWVDAEGVKWAMLHGSEDLADWEHDFQQIATPFRDKLVGLVHPGFRSGALLIKPDIDSWAGDDVLNYAGHSYGAGRASYLAGLRVAEGKKVGRVVLWGEPQTGGPELSRLVQGAGVVVESYENRDAKGHDRVCDVPFNLGADYPYQPLTTRTACEAAPRIGDPWVFFKYHHFGLYCRAFGCGGPAALALMQAL